MSYFFRMLKSNVQHQSIFFVNLSEALQFDLNVGIFNILFLRSYVMTRKISYLKIVSHYSIK